MRTHAGEANGLGATLAEVTEHVRKLARLEVELAKAEVREKTTSLAAGTGLVAAAAVAALFGFGFALAAAASALALALPVWLSLLLVAVALLLLCGGLAAAGAQLLRRGAPPVPTRAVEEARRTADAVREP
jgi:hypothetical protein